MKIVVIGNSASGKSTLSIKISEVLNTPVYHLDKILWKPGWERTSEDEFRRKHEKIMSNEKWIIDGVAYKSTIEERFLAADMIIFLDPPIEVCRERALQRMHEDLKRPNPYVSEGCPYPLELVDEQNKTIDLFHNEYREYISDLVEKYEKSKITYRLSTNKQMKSFLNDLLNF